MYENKSWNFIRGNCFGIHAKWNHENESPSTICIHVSLCTHSFIYFFLVYSFREFYWHVSQQHPHEKIPFVNHIWTATLSNVYVSTQAKHFQRVNVTIVCNRHSRALLFQITWVEIFCAPLLCTVFRTISIDRYEHEMQTYRSLSQRNFSLVFLVCVWTNLSFFTFIGYTHAKSINNDTITANRNR